MRGISPSAAGRLEMAVDRRNTMFIADALALDFLNSVVTRDRRFDWLENGESLLTWLEQARLVPAEAAHTLRVSTFPGELDAVAARARVLRERFRGFVLAHKGKPLAEDVLEKLKPLNHVLEGDEAFSTIAARVENEESAENPPLSALKLHRRRRWRVPASLLLPIAQAMADLVCLADFSLVKECEGPACTILFLDTTHGHVRRWCSMAECGNRAKQGAYRIRARRAKGRARS
jgi:predicted RNA-binding Zn ribbon-like protein